MMLIIAAAQCKNPAPKIYPKTNTKIMKHHYQTTINTKKSIYSTYITI